MCEHMKLWNEKPQKQLKPNEDEELWAVSVPSMLLVWVYRVYVCKPSNTHMKWESKSENDKFNQQLFYRSDITTHSHMKFNLNHVWTRVC